MVMPPSFRQRGPPKIAHHPKIEKKISYVVGFFFFGENCRPCMPARDRQIVVKVINRKMLLVYHSPLQGLSTMQCKSREYTFFGGENLNYELKSFRLYANKPLCFFSSVPCLVMLQFPVIFIFGKICLF